MLLHWNEMKWNERIGAAQSRIAKGDCIGG